jgi:nitrite reductase/ring-hydroxylating ferredoxin subunit
MEALALGNVNHVQAYASTALFFVCVVVAAYTLPAWMDAASKRFGHLLNIRKRRDTGKEASLEVLGPAVAKELDFPEDWYTSEKLFQLEKRAIFSKTWLHVCHSSIFKKPGDYRTFKIADYSFFVILGKDHKLRAFHNVCRHRAYTVATKEQGSCLVLRCKYHGWTYDSKGKLIKAPKFEGVAGFDKSQNGLYEIRTFIDSSGFLYANFDIYGSDGLSIRVGVPIRASLSLVDNWNVETDFNWKIAVPSGAFRIRSLGLHNKLSAVFSSALDAFAPWRWPAEFVLSPLTHLLRSASGDLWLTISIIPQSNSTCTIACSLYCSKLDLQADMPVSAIKSEINDSVAKLQLIFNQSKDDGSIQDTKSQEPLLAEIQAHSRLERLMHKEVNPASRLREASQACKVADDLCKELEAAAGGDGASGGLESLAW